jgi:hypothetical protein
MLAKNPAVEEYGQSLERSLWDASSTAILHFLGPCYRRFKSIVALNTGKASKAKAWILVAMDRLGIDEFVATPRTFVMLVRPIKFPGNLEECREMAPRLRKLLANHYGSEAVKGKIRRERVVSYRYVMEDDLRKRIEADSPLFRREVSILMGVTPELRVSEIPDRVKEERLRKGRERHQ